MAEGKTNMFGKTYNTIGSTDSNFIIKTKGDLKIQWGNKFIDLIKNGKIIENSIFKTVDSEDKISSNGIYLVNDAVWIKVGDFKSNLFDSSKNAYISFLNEQNLNSEQKNIALKNIGFIYDSIDSINTQEITSGIVFIQDEQKLYTIKDGNLSLYSQPIIQGQQDSDIIKKENSLSFQIGEFSYLVMSDLKIKVQKNLVLDDNISIMSNNASQEQGFRLYYNDASGSTLEVDNIIHRNYKSDVPIGTIIMWSGTQLPEGWGVCDGTNNTPNLIDRFVLATTETNVFEIGDKQYSIIYIIKVP